MAGERVWLQVALLLLASVVGANADDVIASSGKEFHLMFMPNVVKYPHDVDKLVVILANPSLSVTASVKVSVPRSPEFGPFERIIPPSTTAQVYLPMQAAHEHSGIANRGVYVVSDHNITVTGMNRRKFSVDSFLVLPKVSLNVAHVAACYSANIRTQIGIVAVSDNTQVFISLPAKTDFTITVEHDGVWYSNDKFGTYNFTLRLDRFQSYLLSARGDLTGAQIKSNKKVAVFSGNVRARVGVARSRDHLVEQMLPVEAWAEQWYTVPMSDEPQVYRIIGEEGGVSVRIEAMRDQSIQGGVIPSERHFVEYKLPVSQPAWIACSSRCLVYQIAPSMGKSGLGDPSMITASNPDVFGTHRFVFRFPDDSSGTPYERNKVLLLSRQPIPIISTVGDVVWTQQSAYGVYFGVINVDSVDVRTAVVRTTSDTPFVAWLVGYSDRESYGHSLGYKIFSPTCVKSMLMRPGDGIDNDCDGHTDEEENAYDGLDNDGDFRFDEDVDIGEMTLSSGKDYIMMFMENSVEVLHRIPLEVFIGGLQSIGETKVEISYPVDNGNQRETITTYIFPREVHKIQLNHTVMQVGSGLKRKSILVRADNDIVVYGINKEIYSADGFLALPISSLGSEYYTVSYHPPTSRTEFAIAAVNDSTSVEILLPPESHVNEGIEVVYNGEIYRNEELLTVQLNALDTFQLQDGTGKGDLSGTYIKADKPIAVFSGNIRTFVEFYNVTEPGSRDHLVEQVPPLNSYGRKFAMFTTPERTVGDYFKMVASLDDTVITVCMRSQLEAKDASSCSEILLLKAGCHESIDLRESGYYIYLESNKPIMVVQITRSQFTIDGASVCLPPAPPGSNWEHNCTADPAMMLIAPLEQYSKDYTFLTPTIANPERTAEYKFHWLMIIIEESDIPGLMIDDNLTSFQGAQWQAIPETPNSNHNLMATAVKLPFALHTLSHSDPSAVYMGLLYGVADRESYGFPIGLRLDDLKFCSPSDMMIGDMEDNDCDSKLDEEICDDDIDNDNDGRLDEDCYEVPSSHSYLAVFMQNTVEPVATQFPLRLYAASFNQQIVRIHTPAYRFHGQQTYDRALQVSSNKVLNFGLRPAIQHTGSGVSTRGIIIDTQNPLDLFGSNKEKFSHDCFLLFPVEVLGTEYYSLHYYPSTLFEEFAITPSRDDTQVTVTLSSYLSGTVLINGKNLTRNEEISVQLDLGESLQIQSASSTLTGTRIASSHPIAVFSGNARTSVQSNEMPSQSRDHLVEQLLPATHWRNEYFAPTSPFRDAYDVFIFFSKEEITVSVSGSMDAQIVLAAGEPGKLKLPSGNTDFYRFRANEPFQVARVTWSQLSHSEQTDPAMLLLIPEFMWKSSYAFALPIFTGGNDGGDYRSAVQIVINRYHIPGLRENEKPFEATWYDIGDSNMVVTTIELVDKPHFLFSHVENVKFMAYLYGAQDRESYAMPCGVSIAL